MSSDDALRSAAEQRGVLQVFYDVFFQKHVTSQETNRAILATLGDLPNGARSLPAVMVVSENEPIRIPDTAAGANIRIVTEAGETLAYSPGMRLPAGYHEMHAGDARARLIVTPDRAYVPDLHGRRAGVGVMVHGLRSRRNWGCGDFRDLRDFTDWARETLHAEFIALNPLHAIHNRIPFNASPYLPTSIFYRNFLYLDVEGVPGFDCIRHRFEDSDTRAELQRLRYTPEVEYEAVAALKRRALDLIFEANPPGRDCREWIAAEGDLLRLYATWCALDEHLHRENPNVWVWPQWPEQYRDPENPAVSEFARTHEKEVLFYGWLQWQVDRQLASLQKHAHTIGMSIGLYHDMALATDSCGSDLWAHRSFYIPGCRVGAPPDAFSPNGQDWSFPPPNRERHQEDGYRLFADSIRKSLRHGGALRIDHVMRLFRLYWIPKGHDATDGAYVRDRAEDLMRIIALESVRNHAVVVGEDLGTVEDEAREMLSKFGILSYRLLYFESSPADQYPEQALVSSTTHDLATIAGFWTANDIEERLRAGTADRAAYEKQLVTRAKDKQRLLDNLFNAGLVPENYERNAARIPELTGELHSAIMGFLASTPSLLWLINQEDITKEPNQQNLPGTTSEYPNWTRRMRWTIEELRDNREARDCVAMLRHGVEVSGRSAAGRQTAAS